jgi:hypothetical protein
MASLKFQYTATADIFGDIQDVIAFCKDMLFHLNFDYVTFSSMSPMIGGDEWTILFFCRDDFDKANGELIEFYLNEENVISFLAPLDRPARETAYLVKRLGVNEDLIAQFTSPAAQAFARAMFDKSQEMLALTHQPHRER